MRYTVATWRRLLFCQRLLRCSKLTFFNWNWLFNPLFLTRPNVWDILQNEKFSCKKLFLVCSTMFWTRPKQFWSVQSYLEAQGMVKFLNTIMSQHELVLWPFGTSELETPPPKILPLRNDPASAKEWVLRYFWSRTLFGRQGKRSSFGTEKRFT